MLEKCQGILYKFKLRYNSSLAPSKFQGFFPMKTTQIEEGTKKKTHFSSQVKLFNCIKILGG